MMAMIKLRLRQESMSMIKKLIALAFFAAIQGCDVSVSQTATGGGGGNSDQEQEKPAAPVEAVEE